jgi:CRP/FNR family transcriptional regulator
MALPQVSYQASAPSTLEQIVRRGIVTHVGAGHVFIDEGEVDWAGILLSGVARVYLTTREGRQVTVRYVRQGGSVGIPCVVGQENPARVETVTDTRLLRISVSHLRHLAERDASVAWALARELAQRLLEICAELERRVESSVRQRVARLLLELSAPAGDACGGDITISQEALAQSIGSAREVVSKVLIELRREGTIQLGRESITIADLTGLRAASEEGPGRHGGRLPLLTEPM